MGACGRSVVAWRLSQQPNVNTEDLTTTELSFILAYFVIVCEHNLYAYHIENGYSKFSEGEHVMRLPIPQYYSMCITQAKLRLILPCKPSSLEAIRVIARITR